MMKAIFATAPGGPDVLQLRDAPMPGLPSPHHLRVKLAAAGVNPVDTKLRAKPAYHPGKLPAILGCDGAGLVEETGSAVTRFKVGDAVFFCNGGIGDEPGCYAEHTTLHEDYCAAKPANLSLEDSAALPLVLLAAWEALVERASLQAGQTVLIHAAAGGVGHIAVQLAHHLGARIAVTVSDDKKAGLAHGLGAEKIINYKEQDFVQEVLQWTGGMTRCAEASGAGMPPPRLLPQTAGYAITSDLASVVCSPSQMASSSISNVSEANGKGADVVFDTVGGETFLRSLNAVRVGGKLATLLSTPLSLADTQLARLRNLSLCYDLMLTPQVMNLHDERVRQRKILEQGARLVEAGKLGVLVSHKLPLEQAAEAHRLIEAGSMTGKVVLTMG
ncbi:MAG TPA: zinc-binding dehydrogenase [Gallionella sp.]|nr:zinc-binding dehydrogenase [Gallionella sp.]